jgi:uncharacterized protein
VEYSQGTVGRVFFIRFDNDDDVVEGLSLLAEKEKVSLASVNILGALRSAELVCGPKTPELPPVPNFVSFDDVREVLGFGTITSRNGKPRIHLHASFGKKDTSLTGCLRKGNRVFITIEAVVSEIKGVSLDRKVDEGSGIDLVVFDAPENKSDLI